MRIGFNLLSWVPGQRGGIETYNRSLLRALLDLDTDDTFVLFVGRDASGALGVDSSRLEERVCPVRSRLRPVRAVWEQTRFGAWIARGKVDVLYCPHSLLPAASPVPAVQLIHDLQVFDLPANFPLWKRAYLYRRLPASAHRAARVIAISEFTRQSVLRHLRVPPEKVTVIPEAAGSEFFPRPEKEVAASRARYGISGPYLLCLSTSHKHKGLDRLVRVFDRLKAERGWREQLILAGLPGSGDAELQAALRAVRYPGEIRHLGRLPSEALPALYTGAVGLVFPSCYEGFGLPVVEAMACGCPVACTNAGSLPEAAGGAAVLFEALSDDALASAIIRLVEDPQLRERLRSAGLERVKSLTWTETARQTLAVLHEVGERA